jgi:predicted nucleic acid-binding protein
MSVDGPAMALLGLVKVPPHQLVTSQVLLNEARRILTSERLRRYHGLDDADLDAFLDGVLLHASLVVIPASIPAVVPHDPLDDHVVFAALAGQVEVLCTRDNDLREPGVIAYCGRRGIRVLTDLELLAELRAAGQP